MVATTQGGSIKNGKALTAKQLGIPSGVRLSKVVIDNIVRVAIRVGFNEKGMELAEQECEIVNCMNAHVIPLEMRQAHQFAIDLITGVHTHNAADTMRHFKVDDEVTMLTHDGVEIRLGNRSYRWQTVGDNEKEGVLSSKILKQFISEDDVWWDSSLPTSSEYMWINRHFVYIVPHDTNCQPPPAMIWNRLPAYLRKRILVHVKKCDELITQMEAAREGLFRVLHTYTSAVKLCNDAPEFVDWINEAQGMNAQGRKCTDVTVADDIAGIRKNLGVG